MTTVAYDPSAYDPSAYDIGGLAGPLALVAERGATVWVLVVDLLSAFPITYPRFFGIAPLRLSSLDLQCDGTALGSTLCEGRLLETPVVTSSGVDEFGGVRDGETLRFRCVAAPAVGGTNLHAWVNAEHRGKPVEGWLVELDPTTLVATAATQAFRGEVVAMADDPDTAELLVRVFDVLALTQTVPVLRVDASWAPYAPATGLGQVVPHGVGIGRRIRCPCVRARSLDDTLITATASASAATDVLTIAAGYDWQTGDGPLRVSSTGTLPAPLLAGVDYFAIAVDQDTQLRLATTRGNATAGTAIDLTTAGSGTLTVSAGIEPNLNTTSDFVVGVGNIAVNQVWIDGETEQPEWPLGYEVVTQEYRAGGRYLTVIRFADDFSESVVEADVLRVDPDVDGSCTLDLKFCRGFQEDARQWALAVSGTTTADLVQGVHRFRLGAWGPPAAVGQISLPPEAVQMATRSVHLIWMAPGLASAGDALLWRDGSMVLIWRAATQALEFAVHYQRQAGDPGSGELLDSFSGEFFTTWTATTATNTAPLGAVADIVLRFDDGLGLVRLGLNGAPATLSHAKPGARQFFGTILPPLAGAITGKMQRLRAWARVLSDDEITQAQWQWRRNGVTWMRELLETVGLQVDPATMEVAAAAWQAVEGGALVVDGWMTQETELRAALLAVALMRGVRVTFTSDGIQIIMPSSTPTTTAALGYGDAIDNLMVPPARTRASLTEAPQELQVRFRRQRVASTDSADYGRTISRPAFAAGRGPVAIELPFVDDAVAADIVSHWLRERLVARDQLLRLEAGREARDVQVGQVVTVAIPSMGITWAPAEVLGRDRGEHRQGLQVVPWATAAFTYVPQPLPPDPMEPFFEPVWLGFSTFLRATLDGKTVTLEVLPADHDNLHPVADGLLNPSPILVGGSSAWQVLDDDLASTYIAFQASTIPSSANWTFRMELAQARPILQVEVSADVRSMAVSGPDDMIAAVVWDTVLQQFYPLVLTPTSFSWTPITTGNHLRRPSWVSRGDVNPTGVTPGATIPVLPWTPERVNKLTWGVLVSPSGTGYQFRVEEFQISVKYRVEVTRDCYTRIWRTGPGASTGDPFPAETLPPRVEGWGLGPFLDEVGGQTGDQFLYWARVYDVVGRPVKELTVIVVDVP